jgi:hypothetical protein
MLILALKVFNVNGKSLDDYILDHNLIYFPMDIGGTCPTLQAYVDLYGAWFPEYDWESIMEERMDLEYEYVGR